MPITHPQRTLSLLLLFTSSTLFAHTPYYSPSSFEAINDSLITLDASFAEKFFIPEVAFNDGNFIVTSPKGLSHKPDTIQELKTRTVVEHLLEEDGTYRFSTGKRIGAVFTVYEHEGDTNTARGESAEIPSNAKILERYQSLTIAETYVSKGAPNDTALAANNQGLEIVADTHPNDLFAGDVFSFHVLLDGKPLPRTSVEAYLAKDQFSVDKPALKLKTDERGYLKMPFEKEGVYLLRARHRAPAPTNAKAPMYSHTYTLVIEIFN